MRLKSLVVQLKKRNPKIVQAEARSEKIDVEVKGLFLGGHGRLAATKDDTAAFPVAAFHKIVGTVCPAAGVGPRGNDRIPAVRRRRIAKLGPAAASAAAAGRERGPERGLAEAKVEAVVDDHRGLRVRAHGSPMVILAGQVVHRAGLADFLGLVSPAVVETGENR